MTVSGIKDADISDHCLSADLHRTDYPEGVRQSSADSELRGGYRSRRSKRGGVGRAHEDFSHKTVDLSRRLEGGEAMCGCCWVQCVVFHHFHCYRWVFRRVHFDLFVELGLRVPPKFLQT